MPPAPEPPSPPYLAGPIIRELAQAPGQCMAQGLVPRQQESTQLRNPPPPPYLAGPIICQQAQAPGHCMAQGLVPRQQKSPQLRSQLVVVHRLCGARVPEAGERCG